MANVHNTPATTNDVGINADMVFIFDSPNVVHDKKAWIAFLSVGNSGIPVKKP
jgi:hypothetical protein